MKNSTRHKRFQTDKTREKIKTTQLVNRLTDYADGKIKLEAGQVKAIDILLSKTLPNLTQADITQHQAPEQRTYEEIRAELIKEHGEPLALLLLKEIGQADYLTMIQANNMIECMSKQALDTKLTILDKVTRDVNKENEIVDVAHPHTQSAKPDLSKLN